MQETLSFERKALPAVIAAVLGGASLNAQAVTITASSATASSDYSIDGGAVVAVSESAPPLSMVDIIQFASSGNVSILTHPYVFVPSLVFGNRASGDIQGGPGSYNVNASVVLDLDVDVSAGGEMFSFTLQPGEVGVTGPSGGLLAPDFLRASLDLLIQDVTDPGNVVELFRSEYDVDADENGASVSTDGTPLGALPCAIAGSSAMCSIDGASYDLSLAEGVEKLRYTLTMHASGSLSEGYDCGSGGGGSEGSGDVELAAFNGDGEGSGFGGPCGSIARTGDPIRQAPEPASLALSALGLAALGLARRRRRQGL